MVSFNTDHYFSPRSLVSASKRCRDSGFLLRLLRRRRWRPAKLRGHSVSSALPCISFHNRAEGTAGTFQRGKFPNLHFIRKRISQTLLQALCPHSRKTHSTQQAWMYSRNQTTIASAREHRQPVFLHPTHRTKEMPLAWRRNPAALADSASSLYTTSFPNHSTIVLRNFGNAE